MAQSTDVQKLVLNLEKWRTEHDLSQAEFARSIDMSPSAYHRLVTGESSTISADTIRDVYKVTGYLCYQLMEIVTDDYLKLGEICSYLDVHELKFMLQTATNLLEMRKKKQQKGAGKGDRKSCTHIVNTVDKSVL